MVVELHRGHLDHLIAPVAHPDDAESFYSPYDLRPVQLLFAKRSGGKERYRETYERLKPEIANAKWLPEEYVAMREAAEYFQDKESTEILSKALSKLAVISYSNTENEGVRTLWSSFLKSTNRLFSPYDIWPPALPRQLDFLHLAKSLKFSKDRIGHVIPNLLTQFFLKKAEIKLPRLDNPYQPGFAEFLRAAKGNRFTKDSVRFLATCVDLPADVQIELMDIDRTLPADKLTPTPALGLEFPMDRIGEITLDSLATARHIANWLGNETVAGEIDRRLDQPARTRQDRPASG